MELLFIVDTTFLLEGVGLVLAPGVPVDHAPIEPGTPIFLVKPDGTHALASVRPLAPLLRATPTSRPIAIDLASGEVPRGTRVFTRSAK